MKGYVYVMSNPSMPGLLKIGFSSKDPKERAAELSKDTGVPKPFVVEYEAHVENPKGYEQSVHKRLQQKRYGKEFFECSVEEAVIAIKNEVGSGLIYEEYHKAKREQIEESKKSDKEERAALEKQILMDEKRNVKTTGIQKLALKNPEGANYLKFIILIFGFVLTSGAGAALAELIGIPWGVGSVVGLVGGMYWLVKLIDKFLPEPPLTPAEKEWLKETAKKNAPPSTKNGARNPWLRK